MICNLACIDLPSGRRFFQLFRIGCALVLACSFWAANVQAKDWAVKMFKVTSHDFGHVAHGAKTEFAFEFQNLYEEDVHIAEVRSSCGCTSATVNKTTLKTWEKGAILTTFNTKSFQGQRSSTITVVIDRPFRAEVQLAVSGYIHNEVDFQPGSVVFGDVEQGTTVQQRVAVTFYGRSNWNIVDVRSANEHLEVELSDAVRQQGRTVYQMTVRLKPDAPAGYINDTLTLVTDDRNVPTVPLTVEGKVTPALTISPSSLFLGVLEPGQSVTKQLVVRAKRPFKITAVRCDGEEFDFKTNDQARPIHLIPVTFTAGNETGEIQQVIEIETTLPAGGKATCVARGTIRSTGGTQPPPRTENALRETTIQRN
jgi:hypothetical protein